MTTSKVLKPRRGSTAEHATFKGQAFEITFDTDKKTIVAHDGLTTGGFPLAHEAAIAETDAALRALIEQKVSAGVSSSDLKALESALTSLIDTNAHQQAVRDDNQDNVITALESTLRTFVAQEVAKYLPLDGSKPMQADLEVLRDLYIRGVCNSTQYAVDTQIVDGETPAENIGSALAFVDKNKTKWLGSVSQVQLTGGFQGLSFAAYKNGISSSFDLGVDKAGTPIGRVVCSRFGTTGSLYANDGRMRLDRLDSSEYDHYRIYDPVLGKGVWADFGRFTGEWARLLTNNDMTVPIGIFADISWVPDAVYTAPADGFIAYRGANNYGSDGVWGIDFYDSNNVWLFSAGSSVTNGSVVGMLIPVSAGMMVVPRAGARTDCISFRFLYTKGS